MIGFLYENRCNTNYFIRRMTTNNKKTTTVAFGLKKYNKKQKINKQKTIQKSISNKNKKT